MLLVAAFALYAGNASTRLMACAVVASYALNRVFIGLDDNVLAVACQGLSEAALMLLVFVWCSGKVSRGFAGLFLVDVAIYAAFLNRLVVFDTMATASLVTFYFQLLLVLSGAINGTLVSHRRGLGRAAFYRGNGHGSGRLSPQRHYGRSELRGRNDMGAA